MFYITIKMLFYNLETTKKKKKKRKEKKPQSPKTKNLTLSSSIRSPCCIMKAEIQLNSMESFPRWMIKETLLGRHEFDLILYS